MLVWQDIFTDDEVMSDSFKASPCKDMEGNEVPGMFQVESKTVSKGSDNIDIGCGDAFGGFDTKAELKTYLKSYFRKTMKHLKSTNAGDEALAQFKSDALEIVKFLRVL
ncbi:unnamed protein product [Peronospora belbahrii]|uniref:TCTP domain-containing protein n=1 Tax=Peronospora belbahrii TaxID=622444 RepID=A0AAU9L4J1_9STRA|nr:unnamed protein product [Peronospora belbahrii]